MYPGCDTCERRHGPTPFYPLGCVRSFQERPVWVSKATGPVHQCPHSLIAPLEQGILRLIELWRHWTHGAIRYTECDPALATALVIMDTAITAWRQERADADAEEQRRWLESRHA